MQVFPPAFHDLVGPPLELFDIDDAFETDCQKLGRLSNRCKNDDIPYYLQCVAQIMRLPLPPEKKTDPKAILFSMFTDIAHFKFAVSYDVIFNLCWILEVKDMFICCMKHNINHDHDFFRNRMVNMMIA